MKGNKAGRGMADRRCFGLRALKEDSKAMANRMKLQCRGVVVVYKTGLFSILKLVMTQASSIGRHTILSCSMLVFVIPLLHLP